MKLAKIGFARLRKWLCSRFHFTTKQKFNLWRACILPIMTYGVFAVGATQHGLRHILTQIGIMLRTIVRDHSHRTGSTNEQVFQAYSLAHPAALLTAAVEILRRSIAQRSAIILPDDLASNLKWEHLADVCADIHRVQASLSRHRIETALSGEIPGRELKYCCQLCSFCTDHISLQKTLHGCPPHPHVYIDILIMPCTPFALMGCLHVAIVTTHSRHGDNFVHTLSVAARNSTLGRPSALASQTGP